MHQTESPGTNARESEPGIKKRRGVAGERATGRKKKISGGRITYEELLSAVGPFFFSRASV